MKLLINYQKGINSRMKKYKQHQNNKKIKVKSQMKIKKEIWLKDKNR